MKADLLMVIGLGLLLMSGFRLLLEPGFLRKIFGIGLLGHAANLLLIFSGFTSPHEKNLGLPAFSTTSFETMVDPLPQALILTAIVIGFGVTAILIFFSWTQEKENS